MNDVIIIELDMCCEVINENGLDLVFEDGAKWSDEDFDKFGVTLHAARQTSAAAVELKGTEEQLRAYLEHYDFDDADFYLDECRVD